MSRPDSCNNCGYYFDCRKGSIANAYGGLECSKIWGNRTITQSEEKKIDRTKREMDDFKSLVDKVWDEDLTPDMEVIYLMFYKAGLNFK